MMKYSVGSVIQEFRKRKKKTQEELCEGHCEPETLCRIENGNQQASVKLYNELMAELSCPPVFFKQSLTPAQYRRVQLEQEIYESIERGDYEIKELLEQYKSCSSTMDEQEEQFYLYESTYYAGKHGVAASLVLANFVQALQKTFDGYTLQTDIAGTLLMPDEIIIFYNIARCLYAEEKHRQAIAIMSQLYRLYKEYELLDMLILLRFDAIARMLSQWLLADGQLDMALQVADEGCASCTKYGRMKNLPHLLHTKSHILLGLGKKEEGYRLSRQAYSFFEALGNEEMMAEISLKQGSFYECGK